VVITGKEMRESGPIPRATRGIGADGYAAVSVACSGISEISAAVAGAYSFNCGATDNDP